MYRKENTKKQVEEEKEIREEKKKTFEVSSYQPKLSFPKRQLKHKFDKQFSKFIEILKQLHINISFVDVIL